MDLPIYCDELPLAMEEVGRLRALEGLKYIKKV
jgi:hypothetical protein